MLLLKHEGESEGFRARRGIPMGHAALLLWSLGRRAPRTVLEERCAVPEIGAGGSAANEPLVSEREGADVRR